MSGDDEALVNGVSRVCVSQGGLVVWCLEGNGTVTVRDGRTGDLVAVVERGLHGVRLLKAAGGLVWLQHSPSTLKAFDAWSYTPLRTFTISVSLIVPAARGQTFLLTTGGSVSFLTRTLDEESTPPLSVPDATCAKSGGSYIFLGTGTGFVTVISSTEYKSKGKWVAHHNTRVEHIACSSGYTVTAAADTISVWDPFPADGTRRLAALLYLVEHHMAPITTLTTVGSDMCSLDAKGLFTTWSVGPDAPIIMSRRTLPEGITHLAATEGWSGLLTWSTRHDTVDRYLKIYNPSVHGAPEKYIQAQSHLLTTSARVQQSIATAPDRVNRMLARHLSTVTTLHTLHFVGRDAFRKLRAFARKKAAAKGYAKHIQSLFVVNRRVCFDKLARWQVEKKTRRMRIHAAFSTVREVSYQLMRRYFMMWSREKVRRLRLMRHLTLASEVINAAMTRGILSVYFHKLQGMIARRRGHVSRSSALTALLRCTVHSTIQSIYRKWRKYAKSRNVQRNMVDNSLSRTAQGVRLMFYKRWLRWVAKKRRRSKLEDFMTTFGDLGILHSYWRKLKMYVGWSAMVEMNAMQEAAARYFHELVDEEKELLGDIVAVSGESWPACAITSALGMNIEKWMKEGMVFFAGESQEYVGMKMVSEKLQQAWHKDYDIIGELSENLVAPPGVNKEALLWQLCLDLHRRYGKVFKDRRVGPIEILAMRLYTLEGPDVDRHMGFGDVPPPFTAVPESKKDDLIAQWDQYKKLHSSVSKPTVSKVHIHEAKQGDRNPSIYSEMNKALRTSNDIQKWAKLSSLLLAMSMPIDHEDNSPEHTKVLYRGIHNLPETVIAAHKALQRGWSYAWLAPSSTSESLEASADFLKNTDAKFNILFKVVGCSEGLPLHKVSQFPDEAEVLLPPFSTFVVEAEPMQCETYLEISLRFKGTLVQNSPQMMEFVTEVRDEAERAAEMRYNLESTRQLQEVEQSARQFNLMERDLIVERVYAVHTRQVCKIRIHDLEKRKYEALHKIRKRQAEIAYKNALAEKWRPNPDANELQEAVLLLKADGALSFAEDTMIISRVITNLKKKKKPLFIAKEAYNAIRSSVGMYSKGAKKKGELWPVACVKRMTGLDLKKCLTAFKTLVVVSEHLSPVEYNDLLAAVEHPVESLPVMFKAMRDKAATLSTPPMGPTRGGGLGGTFSALNITQSQVSTSPHSSVSQPSVVVTLSPSSSPCGSPASPRRRSSGGVRFMSPATPLEDYFEGSSRRLSRHRLSDAFKVCYDPVKDELVREQDSCDPGSPRALPPLSPKAVSPRASEYAAALSRAEASIIEREQLGLSVPEVAGVSGVQLSDKRALYEEDEELCRSDVELQEEERGEEEPEEEEGCGKYDEPGAEPVLHEEMDENSDERSDGSKGTDGTGSSEVGVVLSVRPPLPPHMHHEPECPLCGNDVSQPFCGVTGRPHHGDVSEPSDDSLLLSRMERHAQSPADTPSPPPPPPLLPPVQESQHTTSATQSPSSRRSSLDTVQHVSPLPSMQEVHSPVSASRSPSSRRASLERAAGETGAALATSALFRVKGLINPE